MTLLLACVGSQPDAATTGPRSIPIDRVRVPDTERVRGIRQYPDGALCGGGRVSCFARVRTDENGRIVHRDTPAQGYAPTDLQAAYGIDPTWNSGATVAVVSAYGYANLESDLMTYRSMYGLPECTSANGCLVVVNQEGNASPMPGPPPAGNDWNGETALDLDMVSAGCPNCKILAVQADDDQGSGLFVGNNVAAMLGATVISNSWGGPENTFVQLSGAEAYFDHPGISVFVATGDSGYDDGGKGAYYPSTSSYTIGVGGTTLVQSSAGSGWMETAWTSGGSSCSGTIKKPPWQTSSACSYRMTSDVSAVADPNTGVAVYYAAEGGWEVIGGTSVASPLVAAMFAATGHGNVTPQYPYQHAADFNDITTGSNGGCGTSLCNAGSGWDGPTGIGTPNAAELKTDTSGGGVGGDGSGSGYRDHGRIFPGCSSGGDGGGAAIGFVVGALAFASRRRRHD